MEYVGTCNPDDGTYKVTVDGQPLDPRLDLVNHASTGFSWGYLGSGPAQLALALVAHHTGDDALAVRVHQMVKASVVAGLDEERGWRMSGEDIEKVIAGIGASR